MLQNIFFLQVEQNVSRTMRNEMWKKAFSYLHRYAFRRLKLKKNAIFLDLKKIYWAVLNDMKNFWNSERYFTGLQFRSKN